MFVDGNRDGQISLDGTDDTAADKPFRFWVNDDDDGGTTLIPPVIGIGAGTTFINETDAVPVQQADYTRHKIVSKRNLEDCGRLWINLSGLQGMITDPNTTFQIGLKWADGYTGTPAINIYPSAEGTGSDSYLRDDAAAQAQITGVFNTAVTDKNNKNTVDTTGTFIIKSDYWTGLTAANPNKCLLFEGAGIGKGQLVIVILDASGNQIGEGPGVWLDLKRIKSMYEGLGTAFDKPADETPQGIVFVHGWNMSPEGSTSFAETMFKRLWHRGFKGRLVSIRWNTNYSDAFDNVPLVGEAIEGYLADYNGSERVAWQSGAIVKAAVDGLPAGYSQNIIAHSMGNIVAGSALLSGVTFDNYVLMQAAVPASCYDDRVILKQAERLSPDSYAGFHPTFWEADASPDDDTVAETRAMSYRGRLSSTTGNLVSFYLTNDHATTYAWEFNNDQTKPIPNYGYTRGAPATLGAQRALWRQIGMAYKDSLTDPLIAMPFVCRSWSKVVGAESRTAGSIKSSFNLNSSPSFFDTEHSAQFNRSIQVLKPFYDELLRRLQITPNP
ncbi:MAG: hypothetical protein IPP19_09415 [Verrucomicrobia bacterium]|nr:hypothetical protein [Verrucomicrobiota bacterium]